MAHIHDVFDTEPRYSIDPVKRTISHLSKDEELIVQGDHNSERFAFELPKYIDGHDMSLCNQVRVHYINIGTDNRRREDVYDVDDLQSDPEDSSRLVFSWLISANATSLAGSLNFAIQFKCIDVSTGEADYVWNTVPYTGIKVSSGINSSDTVATKVSDILDTWYSRLVESGDTGIDRVEEATNAALNRIDEKAVYFANAIDGSASGEAVRIDGVSPISHPVQVQLKSKNLFMVPYARTLDGVTLSIDGEGVVHLNGMAEKSGNFQVETIIDKAGKYYLADFAEGTFPSDENSRCQVYQPSTSVSIATRNTSESSLVTSGTFQADHVWIRIRFENGFTYNDCKLKPTLFYEETPTEYIPYVSDLAAVNLQVCGRNLFNLSNYNVYHQNAVMNTNANHVYDITGDVGSKEMAYSAGGMRIKFTHDLPWNKSVTISFDVKLIEQGQYDNRIRIWGNEGTDSVDYRTFNLTVGVKQRISMTFTPVAGRKITAVLIYLNNNHLEFDLNTMQVEYGDADTEYLTYVGSKYNSNSDGSLSIPSISPTMTLFTDTAGVIVNAEYNRDTGHYLKELKDLIKAGGSMSDFTLIDTATGDFYKLAVTNGKLTLAKWEV